MTPMLLSYPGHEALASGLHTELRAESVAFELRSFPDGETYIRIDSDVRDRDVAVLCTLHRPDARILPLVFIVRTLRELGARSVGLIAPYLAYMRQDKRFHPGEAVTSEVFAQLISSAADWLVTMDPHLHRRRSLAEIYSIPTAVTHAAPLLSDWIRAHIDEPLVIGPDYESEQWVRGVAEGVACPYVVLEKTRRGDRDVSVSEVTQLERWRGRTPVLVDDIISSARTMAAAVRQFRDAGFAAPVCVGVHAVFADDALETLRAAGAGRVVTTNTIAHPSNGMDIASLLAAPVNTLFAETTRQSASAK